MSILLKLLNIKGKDRDLIACKEGILFSPNLRYAPIPPIRGLSMLWDLMFS